MAMVSVPFLLLICSLVLVAVAQQWLRWIFVKLRHHQPGPLPIPILGNLLHLTTSPFPHRSLFHLSRKYGPIFYLQLGIVPTVIVSTPAAAQQVLHSHDKSLAGRPYFTSLVRLLYGIDKACATCPYNDQWRWNRKFYSNHIFNARYHHEIHVPVICEEICSALMGDVYVASRAGSEVNLSELSSKLVHNIMYRIVVDKLPANISTPTTTTNAFTLAREVERLASVNRIGEVIPFLSLLDRSLNGAIDRCHRTLDAMLEGVITEREIMNNQRAAAFDSKPSPDGKCILDIMLASDPPMERDKIKAMIMELMTAGTTSTASTLEWAMSELLNNERVMRKAVEELDRVAGKEKMVVSWEDVRDKKMPYLQAVVKETLRLHPPGPLLVPHFATETCEVKLQKETKNSDGSTYEISHRISPGTQVMVNAWGTWGPTANEFAPERFLVVDGNHVKREVDVKGQDFGLLPFGSGRRMCPGLVLAMSILELTIASFVHCFEWKSKELPVDMTEDFGLNLMRRSPLFALPTSFRLPAVNPALTEPAS